MVQIEHAHAMRNPLKYSWPKSILIPVQFLEQKIFSSYYKRSHTHSKMYPLSSIAKC